MSDNLKLIKWLLGATCCNSRLIENASTLHPPHTYTHTPHIVQDLQYDPEDTDDFSTPEDDRGKAILAAIQEEKRKK